MLTGEAGNTPYLCSDVTAGTALNTITPSGAVMRKMKRNHPKIIIRRLKLKFPVESSRKDHVLAYFGG
jgi:hypothetical protein